MKLIIATLTAIMFTIASINNASANNTVVISNIHFITYEDNSTAYEGEYNHRSISMQHINGTDVLQLDGYDGESRNATIINDTTLVIANDTTSGTYSYMYLATETITVSMVAMVNGDMVAVINGRSVIIHSVNESMNVAEYGTVMVYPNIYNAGSIIINGIEYTFSYYTPYTQYLPLVVR